MSCKICGRSSCTQSFHSIAEQDLFEQRELMPDDVQLLRRMVQEAAGEILSLKKELESETRWAKLYLDRADLSETQNEELRQALQNAACALDNAGNDFASKSAYKALNCFVKTQ